MNDDEELVTMAAVPASLAYMTAENPQFVLDDLAKTREQQWYLAARGHTKELIARCSTRVALHLEQNYRDTRSRLREQWRQMTALAALLDVEVDDDWEPEDAEDLRFVWGTVADGCVLAHLDSLADSPDYEVSLDGRHKLLAERVDRELFHEATGVVEDDQPRVLWLAGEAMFGEPWSLPVLYRDRMMFVTTDGRSVRVEREIPPGDQQRWGHGLEVVEESRPRVPA